MTPFDEAMLIAKHITDVDEQADAQALIDILTSAIK